MFEKGDSVYVIDKPETKGIVTSRYPIGGSYSVNINGQAFYFKEDQIALFRDETPIDAYIRLLTQIDDPDSLPVEDRAYGKARDLNQIIVKEKISGEISDIFYSMHFGNTDFYPHQLKPVLQFLEDDNGSIIIADEVGLGKTMEALFIWEELRVRDAAKNLLIVCPPVLRRKWADELKDRFGIGSRILDYKSFIDELKVPASERRNATIISYDLLSHHADKEDELSVLLQSKIEKGTNCYDLVICDEAHYMRNKSTNTYKMVEQLIPLCHASVFLTATPVQTSDENLFNILHMLYPEDFPSLDVFASVMEENRHVLLLVNYLQKEIPPSTDEGNRLLDDLKYTSFTDNKSLIERTRKAINSGFDAAERTRLAYEYERILPLARYLSRSRKAMVLENKVARHAETVKFNLSDVEKEQYKAVDNYLKRRYETFSWDGEQNYLIGVVRRKMMASSLPVGIQSLSESLDSEDCAYEYLSEKEVEAMKADMTKLRSSLLPFEELKRIDSKYNALSRELKKLRGNSTRKLILFTGYRKTGNYLYSRLTEDGLDVYYIHGSMKEDKNEVLRKFKNCEGAAILLSTEVGSEGIDLQFCDTIINYDLPWNPMRIEQRIGRVDRIGQKSEAVLICNFVCQNTIDDQILDTLLNRIDIFKKSVGNIDQIMGQKIEQFLIKLSAEKLSDEEKLAKVNQSKIVKEATAVLTDDIKNNSTLFSFCGKQFLDKIKKSEELKHYVTCADLKNYVLNCYLLNAEGIDETEQKRRDSFHLIPDSRYPGFYSLSLPYQDKSSLDTFCKKNDSYTKLAEPNPVMVCFGKLPSKKWYGFYHEVIDISHPLIKWLIEQNKRSRIPDKGASVITVHIEDVGPSVKPGMYYYYLQRWDTSGVIKKASRLSYTCLAALLTDMKEGQINPIVIDSDEAELLVTTASEKGNNSSDYREFFYPEFAAEIGNHLLSAADEQFQNYMNEQVSQEDAYKARRKRGLQVHFNRETAILRKARETDWAILRSGGLDEKKRKYYEGALKGIETQIENRKLQLESGLEEVDKMKTVCLQRPLSMGIIYVM